MPPDSNGRPGGWNRWLSANFLFWQGREGMVHRRPSRGLTTSFDVTIECVDGGYSSAAERLTVAQDVVGSIPTSRPNSPRMRHLTNSPGIRHS